MKRVANQLLLLTLVLTSLAIPNVGKADYTVSGTVTITSTPWHPNGNVIIEAGGKLTIQSGVTVQMDADKKIHVKADGRLHADGVTFTAYSSSHWLGIEVWGNPSINAQPTFSDAQNLDVHSYSGGSFTTDQKGAVYIELHYRKVELWCNCR